MNISKVLEQLRDESGGKNLTIPASALVEGNEYCLVDYVNDESAKLATRMEKARFKMRQFKNAFSILSDSFLFEEKDMYDSKELKKEGD